MVKYKRIFILVVKSIFDETKCVDMRPPTKLSNRKGLIKSHKTYPWNYHEIYQNLTNKYKFKLKKRVLIIGLKFVHVCDGDSLVLNTKDRRINIAYLEEDKQMNFTKNDDGFVELEFHIDRYSGGCGGFLICYNGTLNFLLFFFHLYFCVSVYV